METEECGERLCFYVGTQPGTDSISDPNNNLTPGGAAWLADGSRISR